MKAKSNKVLKFVINLNYNKRRNDEFHLRTFENNLIGGESFEMLTFQAKRVA